MKRVAWACVLLAGCSDDAVGATVGGDDSGSTLDDSATSDTPPDATDAGPPEFCGTATRYPFQDEVPGCDSLAVGQFDDDSYPDLVALQGGGFIGGTERPRILHTWFSQTGGPAPPERQCCIASGGANLSAFDINADGRDDLLLVNTYQWWSGDVGGPQTRLEQLLRGPVSGWVAPRILAEFGLYYPARVLVGRWSSDQDTALAHGGDWIYPVASSAELPWLAAPGAAVARPRERWSLSALRRPGEPRDAVLVTTEDGAFIEAPVPGGPAGTFQEQRQLTDHPGSFVVADLDGDGAEDIVEYDDDQLRVARAADDFAFGSPQAIPGSTPAFGDIDGDGVVDLVRAESDDPDHVVAGGTRWAVYRGIGTGAFETAGAPLPTTNAAPHQTEVVDLDLDGRGEIIICDYDGVLIVDPG
jgi:hypothetical protein